MPDSDFLLNADPEDILQNPGATGLSDPPPSITGDLANYANQLQPPANSLGLLMDDQQMRDAGVHPEQSGDQAGYSVIDATGAGDPKADPAQGYAKVARAMRGAVTGAHTAASGLAQAPALAKAAATGASSVANAPSIASAAGAWQTVRAAADETAKHPMIAGLKTLNRIYSVPLSVAEGVARGATDLQNGASWPDTLVGNVLRTGLVGGAAMIPYAGPAAAWAANKYLPDGAEMGHAYNQSMIDTDGRALLLP